jgi:hypothetical protein
MGKIMIEACSLLHSAVSSMWPIILIEECGLFEGLRQIVMRQIRILIRSPFFCLDRAPNSIRVHWDEIVWGLNYDQAGEGGKTTSSFTIQTICRLYSLSCQSLVNTLSLSVLIRRKRAGRPASAADYYVVEVSTGEVKIIRSIHAL